MIIAIKPKKTVKPKLGDRRIVKRFALFPVKLNFLEKVWLQYFYQTEIFETVQRGDDFESYSWHDEWVWVNRYLTAEEAHKSK